MGAVPDTTPERLRCQVDGDGALSKDKLFLASNARKWAWYDGSGVYVARAVVESRQRFQKDPEFHFWHYPWRGDRYGNPVQLITQRHTSDLAALLQLVPVVDVTLEQALVHFKIDRPIVGGNPPHLAYSTRSRSLNWHHHYDDRLYVVHLTRRSYESKLGISMKPLDLSKRWSNIHQVTARSHVELFDDYTFACFNIDAYLMSRIL